MTALGKNTAYIFLITSYQDTTQPHSLIIHSGELSSLIKLFIATNGLLGPA